VIKQSWLLPEGIEELLPTEAASFEALRRQILDLYSAWGYELVNPPIVEFLDSLLTGTAEKLDVETFKLTDQVSGRLMGVRADMTPQLARIDARNVSEQAELPSRLCYVGNVLRTRADEFGGSRNPTQIGVELYGHKGMNSDVEVLTLMCETILAANVKSLNIDIGHVGIYEGLAKAAGLTEEQEVVLFEMMQRKAQTEINTFVDALSDASKDAKHNLKELPTLSGDISTLEKARKSFKNTPASVLDAINEIEDIIKQFQQRVSSVELQVDLAELRGYGYKTGVVFAAFLNGHGREVARGGRYDGVGKRFGRNRAATGFSVDLKKLVTLSEYQVKQGNSILAPAAIGQADLLEAIKAFRQEGYAVIEALDEANFKAQKAFYTRHLEQVSGDWKISDKK